MEKRNAGRFSRRLGILLCLLLLLVGFSDTITAIRELPDDIYLTGEGDADFSAVAAPFSVRTETAEVSGDLSQRLGTEPSTDYEVYIDLFGNIPVRQITVHASERTMLMPGGNSIGVTMYIKVLAVGTGSFLSMDGTTCCPAAEAGIEAGDVILSVNGVAVEDSAHLAEQCERASGTLTLGLLRDGQDTEVRLTPKRSAEDGAWRMGLWVRDSTAGIGTLSFYRVKDLAFGALGHAITDIDTGSLLDVEEGEILDASVMGVSTGAMGAPGELHGTFNGGSRRLGEIAVNTEYGVFGALYQAEVNPLYPNGLPMGYPEEAELGAAELLTTVDGDGIKAYTCEIIKIYPKTPEGCKGIVVEITDPALLRATGGIVQGMSGSPILQNGLLIGAITHVFVNDPTRGYGIFIENMLQAAEAQENSALQ